ncbi:helix-turn-helix domain-containing protein [Waterburya agarophytonicola]|nr:helix-turn-helix domain-containing protein [Waterburya agarophytonicola]
MPEQNDEIFKFDPNSFWGDQEKKQNIDYVRVDNKETGMIAMVSTSTLETQNKQQVLTQIDEFYQQYNVFRSNLKPEEIKQTAQWFKENYQLLNLIARQVVFHLIKLYEHRVKVHLIKTGKLHSQLPTFTLNFDKEQNLVSVELHLSEKRIDQIIKQLEKDITTELKDFQILETAAEEFLTFNSISLVEKMQQNIGIEAFNSMNSDEREKACNQYFQEQEPRDLESKVVDFLKHFSQRNATAIFKTLETLPLTELERTFGFRGNEIAEPVPVTESRLANAVLPIPTFAAFSSASSAQIRKDLWQEDDSGFAYFKHQAKGNPKNYIEHYISNPGDIELLPLEQAEQIIDKFGFNTVKLHLIFAAHTMNQDRPWDSKFSLKASDIIKYLGWDKRTDLPVHQKLSEIAKTAFVLDCLLVKSVWVEGRNKKGGINASTPTGRMWNVVVDPRGEQNSEGKVQKPEEVYITVQPGLIFHSFLNKAGSKLQKALYQFGYLAKSILRIDPYHDELALRLAIHLAMESRVHMSGKYRVETLLKHLLPHAKIDKARSDTRRGYDLKQHWDNALKLLRKLSWQIQFDESYPEWLQPGSKSKKPTDARKMKNIEWLLNAKITIRPPEPIPELLTNKVQPKLKASKQKKTAAIATGITSDQIRKGRNKKGWSQRKLAGWLGVSQSLVKMWEKGRRTPSEETEVKLRQILEIQD